MNHFGRRRLRLSLILFAILLLGGLLYQVLDVSLQPVQFFSGWLLAALVLALTLFNARKKLPFLPVGSGLAWMEFHSYAGVLSFVVFFAHAGLELPTGALETLLALLFLLAAGSGLLGLMLSRLLPVRLATRGEAILFERIPALRRELHDEVEELVLKSASEVRATTIADFYAAQLVEFLRGPRNLVFHLLDSPRPYRTLERELRALERYANSRERECLSEIHERLKLKDDLDYQYSQQIVLKGWLFFHIPFAYSLIVVSILHVMLVYGFHGGFR